MNVCVWDHSPWPNVLDIVRHDRTLYRPYVLILMPVLRTRASGAEIYVFRIPKVSPSLRMFGVSAMPGLQT